MTTVVNKYKEKYDVYIGRNSIWGNPFVIGKDGSREEVIAKYKNYIYGKYENGQLPVDKLENLAGKKLGCFCKPQACHGDVLVELLEYHLKKQRK